MERTRAFVTREIPAAGLDLLRRSIEVEVWPREEPPSTAELKEILSRGFDGLLTLLTDPITPDVMDACPGLRVISNYAVGYDNVDVAAATERGILVTNTPGVLTETTADLAWALLMAAARRVAEADRFVRAGRWRTWHPQLLLGRDVYGATLGIVGMGRIGRAVARRAAGFSMRLLYHSRHRDPRVEEELGASYRSLDDLLRESDFVSLHVPLTEETHHLIGRRELELMKESAVLINTSRGPVVDEAALYEVLRDGRIAAAGLDVTEEEPIPPSSPLLSLERVTILPHIGSASVESRRRMAVMAAENLLDALAGRRPKYLVNPEVLGDD